MARIVVASMPFAGHVGAMTAVAGELAGRGHEVLAYTGAKYAQRFAAVGARWLPWQQATDFDDSDLAATFPPVGDGKGLRGGMANVEHVLLGTGAGQAADLLAEASREPVDLFVTDHLAFGVALAGETLGLPWASVAVTPLPLESRELPPPGFPALPARGPLGRVRDRALRSVLHAVAARVVDPMLNRMRAAAGLPASTGGMDSLLSPHLVLAQGVPGLDYPRGDLPPHVHFVGRLAVAASPQELPAWWPEVVAARADGIPVVHVTQGTLDVDFTDLLKPAIAGLAGERVLVVCTTGGAPVDALGPVPDNVRAARFLPHDQLLPLTDVMVTNGGWNGVLAAVQAGVPLVVAGASLDKPEVARRVAWSGVGRNLHTGRPGAARVRRAVRHLLERPEHARRSRELGAKLAAAGGASTAGDLLEELIAA
ncbi:glycosyltransferase [Catellatospora sp. TT07R-123]|uniref:glycosyltransferase n=1 Tax=Catellatospora sp. TT07R-123 TaxID=2733863 RepID=UPI001BB32893|nr:glycosyltransferase [Catellatospora sp. TT07R-123]